MAIKSHIIFEIKSFIGRTFFNKPFLANESKEYYLNLGCGDTIFEDWINADFFVALKPWKKYKLKPDWRLDLRYPLNCADTIWDGVFTEHTLEHLEYYQVKNLLKELYRTMKYGAWLRITVPDLRKYILYYNGQYSDEKFFKWSTGCEAIHSLTQSYGHLSVWDANLMSLYLKEAGFKNIREVEFMVGSDERLLKDQDSRKWETLYMEGQK